MSSPVAQIFKAAENDDLETVKMFIEDKGILPSITRPQSEETLAHVAAKRGNLDMLKYLAEKDSPLLKAKSDDLLISSDYPSILETAIKYGHLDIIKYLVEVHDVNIFRQRYTIWEHYSAVELAVFEGHLNIVRYLVEEGHVDPNTNRPPGAAHYDDGNPLLFAAIERKQRNITDYLIEVKKVDLTVLDKKKRNILFPAVTNGDFDLIKNVLDVKKVKIDINWRDNEGKTLVYLIASYSHDIDILQYLVQQKRADVNIPGGPENSTPLLEATDCSCFRIFEYLVNHGADLEKRDDDGRTPLHVAAGNTYDGSKFCKHLLEYGADVKSKNNNGETPLQIAMAVENFKVSKCLIDYCGNVNEKIYDGETILHIVAAYNQLDLVKYLVDKKHAQIDVAREEDHRTPLHCAAVLGHHKICEYLIEQGADPSAKDKMGRSPAQLASNNTLIDYIQKAAEFRSRRSVDHSFWILSQHSAPNSRAYLLSGGCNVGETVSANEMETFHLHSLLAFTNFAIRYLFPSFVRTRRIKVNDNLTSNTGNLPNSVVHTAEDDVHAFLDFEEDEEEEEEVE